MTGAWEGDTNLTDGVHEVDGLKGILHVESDVGILNISLGGVALLLHRWLAIGTKAEIAFSEIKPAVSFEGRIVRIGEVEKEHSDETGVSPVFEAGLKFSELFNIRTQALITYISEHTTHNERRITGNRFELQSSAQGILRFDIPFGIDGISHRGVVIKSEFLFQTGEAYRAEMQYNGGTISFTGLIDRISPPEGENHGSHYFVTFSDVTAENQKHLDALVNELGN